MGERQADPALVIGVSGRARGEGWQRSPQDSSVQSSASDPAPGPCPRCLPAVVLDETLPAPAVGSAGRLGPGPWLQELVGGSWQEGRCAVFPGIAGWLPMGTHPVAVDAPSTQHWGQEQQQIGDS